jgi:hypothetical protein
MLELNMSRNATLSQTVAKRPIALAQNDEIGVTSLAREMLSEAKGEQL